MPPSRSGTPTAQGVAPTIGSEGLDADLKDKLEFGGLFPNNTFSSPLNVDDKSRLVQRLTMAVSSKEYTALIAQRLLASARAASAPSRPPGFSQRHQQSDTVRAEDFPAVLRFLTDSWGLPEHFHDTFVALAKRRAGGADVELPAQIDFDVFVEVLGCFFRRVRDRLLRVRIKREAFIRNRGGNIWSVYDMGVHLGEGSFGEAHLVKHRISRVDRVCKTIAKAKIGVPAEELENELQVLRDLDHPHVVRVFESFESFDSIFIIMDWARGGDLRRVLATVRQTGRCGLHHEWVKQAIRQCFLGLTFVHSRRIMHNDIKTSNILLLRPYEEGRLPHVALADFGLAELQGAMQADQPLQLRGSPLYLAPEGWEGQRHLCMKSDVWCLGIVTFELLMGRRPFQGNNLVHLFHQISRATPDIEAVLKEPVCAPESSARFLERVLAKQASERPDAFEAVEDPWLSKKESHLPESLESVVFSTFDGVREQSHFEQCVLEYIASNLNVAEFPELNELFHSLDRNHDGLIDVGELREVLKPSGAAGSGSGSRVDVRELLWALDKDHDDQISYTEFLSGARELRARLTDSMLHMAFDMVDLDGDGYLSMAEMRIMLSGTSGTLADVLPDGSTVESLFEELAGNEGDRVSFANFRDYLMREQMETNSPPGGQVPLNVADNISTRSHTRHLTRPDPLSIRDIVPETEAFEQWWRRVSAEEEKMASTTKRANVDGRFQLNGLEEAYVEHHLGQTIRFIQYACLALMGYSVYAVCFRKMFTRWDTTMNQWSCPPILAHNLGWLFNFSTAGVLLGLLGKPGQQRCPMRCLSPRGVEWLIVHWICTVLMMSCMLCNRWRVSQLFGRNPVDVFGTFNYDDDLLLTLVAIVSFSCIATYIRFRLLTLIAVCTIAAFTVSSAICGMPGAQERQTSLASSSLMLSGIVGMLLCGQWETEKGRRLQFISRYHSWELSTILVKERSRLQDLRMKRALRTADAFRSECFQAITALLDKLGEHASIQSLGLSKDIKEAIEALRGSERELVRMSDRDVRRAGSSQCRASSTMVRVTSHGGHTPRAPRAFVDMLDRCHNKGGVLHQVAYPTGLAMESLHSPNGVQDPLDGVQRRALEGRLRNWELDVLEFRTGRSAVITLGELLLVPAGAGIMRSEQPLRQYVCEVAGQYADDLPFHNGYHAAAAMHRATWLAHALLVWDALPAIERLALVVAALSQDVRHFGRSSDFCTATQHPLAQVFVDDADIMEHFHAALAVGLLQASGVLPPLASPDRQALRSLVVGLILDSSLCRLLDTLAALQRRLDSGIDLESEGDRRLVTGALVQAGDYGYLALPWSKGHPTWCSRYMEELLQQGDEELAWGLPVSPICDRRTWSADDAPGLHIAFITCIAQPLLGALDDSISPHGAGGCPQLECRQHLDKNAVQWTVRAPKIPLEVPARPQPAAERDEPANLGTSSARPADPSARPRFARACSTRPQAPALYLSMLVCHRQRESPWAAKHAVPTHHTPVGNGQADLGLEREEWPDTPISALPRLRASSGCNISGGPAAPPPLPLPLPPVGTVKFMEGGPAGDPRKDLDMKAAEVSNIDAYVSLG